MEFEKVAHITVYRHGDICEGCQDELPYESRAVQDKEHGYVYCPACYREHKRLLAEARRA